jgi:hypothetical protein
MSPQPGRSESATPNAAISILWHANYPQPPLTERFGATENGLRGVKRLENMVGTRRLELLTSTVSSSRPLTQKGVITGGTGRTVILGAICYQIATKTWQVGSGLNRGGIGPFTVKQRTEFPFSPLRHLRRQQLQKHITDHRRLVLSRASHERVGPLKPVWSPDLHLPTVVLARTDDRHAPISRPVAQGVFD